jgi:hypothetical protein
MGTQTASHIREAGASRTVFPSWSLGMSETLAVVVVLNHHKIRVGQGQIHTQHRHLHRLANTRGVGIVK